MSNNGKTIARIGVSSSQEIWVTERNFKGVDYIDVRKFYFDPPDKSSSYEDAKRPKEFFKPTKKGISLTAEQWKETLEVIKKLI
jgi:hypothetical protein